ncbi:MAG TPA: tetratricopeptide repeat protein, partial [Homoserinimonas sp.]|nr:tetratricopeptide repeat protein [Homoserinimonas sp.]
MSDISASNLRGAVDLSSLVRPPSAGQHAAAPAATAGDTGPLKVPSLVVDGTDANFTGILELSSTVPVIVEFYAGQPGASLPKLVAQFGGRLMLATVDAQANPQLQQAFNVTAVPTVAAIVGGRPVPLFQGQVADEQARQVFDQVLDVAAQNGVTGTVVPDDAEGGEASSEPAEEPLPPLHQEAYDAIDRGDYPAAISAYEKAIAQDPRDDLAMAGLAQVSLLHRLEGASAADIRSAAAAAPQDVAAQLAVADLDVSGGHLDDAFDRLLTLFPAVDAQGQDAVRTRLL